MKNRYLLLGLLVAALIAVTVLLKLTEASVVKENSSEGSCSIFFKGSAILVDDDSMAYVAGNTVTFGKSGTYRVSGECQDGQIIVETEDLAKITVVLDGLTLTSTSSSPIFVKKAKQVDIFYTGDNSLTDGTAYEGQVDGKPNACIFSRSDLDLMGDGTLTVNGNFHHGISVRGDLDVESGNLFVNAVGNALDGRDSVEIKGGNSMLVASNDGINSKNNSDANEGTVSVTGGIVKITSGDDGVQAAKEISIQGGEVTIASEGDLLKTDGKLDVRRECVYAVNVHVEEEK